MTGEREGVTIVDRGVQDLLKARGEILIQDISFSLSCGGEYIPLNKRLGTETGFLQILFTADQKEWELYRD